MAVTKKGRRVDTLAPFLNEVLLSFFFPVICIFPILRHSLLHLFVHEQHADEVRNGHQHDGN